MKPRSPGNIAISVSLSQDLLEDIDVRAKSLGLNRSQYLAQLARRDVLEKGHMILTDTSATPGAVNSAKVEAAAEATVNYLAKKVRKQK